MLCTGGNSPSNFVNSTSEARLRRRLQRKQFISDGEALDDKKRIVTNQTLYMDMEAEMSTALKEGHEFIEKILCTMK